jgi:hypothetical protein
MTNKIQVLAWDRHKKYARVKPVNGFPNPLLLIIGFPTTKTYKQTLKDMHRFTSS